MELNTNPTDTCRWYEAATSPFFHYFKIIRLQQNVLQDFVFHLLNHFLMKKNCLTKIKAKIDFRDMHTDSQRTYSILVWEYLKQNMRVCIKKKKDFQNGLLRCNTDQLRKLHYYSCLIISLENNPNDQLKRCNFVLRERCVNNKEVFKGWFPSWVQINGNLSQRMRGIKEKSYIG